MKNPAAGNGASKNKNNLSRQAAENLPAEIKKSAVIKQKTIYLGEKI